jgi:ABC-type bacteriocin/lantibiotic exporter with double-glycine peptidase domain
VTGEALPGSGPVGVKAVGVEVDGARIELDVKPGSRLAMVGGDRRVAEVLAAVRQPDQGVLELAGVDVRRANSCAVHDEVMLIRADDLFSGTVFENVSLTRPGITSQEVRSAVERVGLDDEIRSLPLGYDTPLSPTGAPLSPGQALRLVVARALAASPRLIVVDDTLDVLDPVSRARTVAALTRKDTPWTLIALVSDPGSALARACTEVRDVSSFVAAAPHAPAEAKHS